ncbi:MAG: hypothetical protein NC389_16995, partial [Acetatifactor muris]|nr:hypothetical protein [Acetatifactor muris]
YEDFDSYRRDIIIPEMLIKLRQWFGRGIRREDDTAVFSVLDNRASLGHPCGGGTGRRSWTRCPLCR